MAVRIKKSVSKNSVSYSVILKVRDINGKATTKVVEVLGSEADIRKKHPSVDLEQWARAYDKQLTDQMNQENAVILTNASANKPIPKEKNVHSISANCS